MEALERAIEEQKRFYDLRAPDYMTGASSDRRGIVPDTGLPLDGRGGLVDELEIGGDILELACGPGGFTRELARHADRVTAVDASPAMLACPTVRYVSADLFDWEPDSTYDVVFFGFFLSHVPPAAFESFWELVRAALRPGGRVAFVDEDDRSADFDEVRVDGGIPLARRTLVDGRDFDVVKVFWQPDELAARLRRLDWDVSIRRAGVGLLVGQGVDAR